jgi:hypothetical protein
MTDYTDGNDNDDLAVVVKRAHRYVTVVIKH